MDIYVPHGIRPGIPTGEETPNRTWRRRLNPSRLSPASCQCGEATGTIYTSRDSMPQLGSGRPPRAPHQSQNTPNISHPHPLFLSLSLSLSKPRIPHLEYASLLLFPLLPSDPCKVPQRCSSPKPTSSPPSSSPPSRPPPCQMAASPTAASAIKSRPAATMVTYQILSSSFWSVLGCGTAPHAAEPKDCNSWNFECLSDGGCCSYGTTKQCTDFRLGVGARELYWGLCIGVVCSSCSST